MKLQSKIHTLQDRKMADECIRKMHTDTSNLIAELFERHAGEEHISEVEQVMCDLHTAIHTAQNKLCGKIR